MKHHSFLIERSSVVVNKDDTKNSKVLQKNDQFSQESEDTSSQQGEDDEVLLV